MLRRAVRAAKFTIREGLKDAAERDTSKIATMVSRCFDSEDYREGVNAFFLANIKALSRHSNSIT